MTTSVEGIEGVGVIIPGSKYPVFVCVGQTKHECKHALCFKLYTKNLINSTNERSSRRRKCNAYTIFFLSIP